MQKFFVVIHLVSRRLSLELVHTRGIQDWMITEGLRVDGVKWGKMMAMLFVWKSTKFHLIFCCKSLWRFESIERIGKVCASHFVLHYTRMW